MLGYKDYDDFSKSCLQEILNCASEYDIPIEINGLGMERGVINSNVGERHPYPFLEFWQTVSKTNVKVICNSDAHKPYQVIQNVKKAHEFAKEVGITPIASLL